MSSAEYNKALTALAPASVIAVQSTFAAWSTHGSDLSQVISNIESETALSLADFTSLLEAFVTELQKHSSARAAWQKACRAHKLKGRLLLMGHGPQLLGRVKGLEDHAVTISNASAGDLTIDEVRSRLLKYRGELLLDDFEYFLRVAPIGNYIVWGTFDAANPAFNPFDKLPKSQAAICTVLGLGHFKPSDSLIVLVWDHLAAGTPPLHRPTVADAEDYPHYRPCPDADAPWGLTGPLLPNPSALLGQPEVVLGEIDSKSLLLPFVIIEP